MLEHQRLRILPWDNTGNSLTAAVPEAGAGPWRRMVVEANTGKPVGFVCQWLPAPPRWLRWFLPRLHLWEIHEIEDESLLFTMQEWKGLLPFVKRVYWQVGDAEDHSLGTVESRKQSEPSGWISTAAARDPRSRPTGTSTARSMVSAVPVAVPGRRRAAGMAPEARSAARRILRHSAG